MDKLLHDNRKFKELIDHINNKKYFEENYSSGIAINDENFILINDLEGISFDALNHSRYLIISKNSLEYYNKIMKIYSSIEKSKGAFEVIIGNYSIIKRVNGNKYIYPLITTNICIDFDASSEEFIISIKNGKLNFEIEMLSDFSTSFKALLKLRESFNNRGIAFSDVVTIEWYIKELKYILLNNTSIDENLNLKTLYDKHVYLNKENPITIYKNTVLFMRETKDYNIDRNFISQLDNDTDIEEITKTIVKEKTIVEGLYESDTKNLSVDKNLKEVLSIIDKNYGLVVEGIDKKFLTSIVLNLMASDKKVLITSKEYKELEELKNQFEVKITPLITTNKSMNIQQNIKKINEMISLNPATFQRNRYALEKDASELKLEIKNLKEKIEEINEIEKKKIKYDGNIYSFDELETWLSIEEKSHSWIEEDISLKEKPPINNNQMIRILYLLDKIPKLIIENTNKYLKNLEYIPDKEKLKNHIQNIAINNHREEYYESRLQKYHVDDKFTVNDDIYHRIDEAIDSLEELKSSKFNKIEDFYKESEIGKAIMGKIYILLKSDIKRLVELISLKEIEKITIPSMDISLVRLKSYANDMYNEVIKKGRLSSYYKVKNSKKLKYLNLCKIGNDAVQTADEYFLLIEKIELCIIEDSIRKLWNENCNAFGGEKISDFSVREIAYLEEAFKYVTIVVMWKDKYIDEIKNQLKGITSIKKLDYWSVESFCEVKEFLQLYNEKRSIRESREYIVDVLSKMKNNAFLEDLKEAIENKNILSIDGIYSNYKNYEKYAGDVKEFNIYFDKIKNRLSKTINKIMVSEDKLKYKDIMKAWHYTQLKTLKDRIDSLGRSEAVAKLQSKEQKLMKLQDEIVVNNILSKTINDLTIEKRREIWNFSQFIGSCNNEEDVDEIIKNEIGSLKEFIPVWLMSFDELTKNNIQYDFDIVLAIDKGDASISILPQILSSERAIIFKESSTLKNQFINQDKSLTFFENILNNKITLDVDFICKDIEVPKVS